jgi:ATP-dependent helicase/nuclease subunit B
VWDNGIESIRSDLREWLRRGAEDESGCVPWRFELTFGLNVGDIKRHADVHSVPKPVDLDCGIQLRGSIDLIERHPTGQVRITDHKTGKAEGEDGQIIAGGKTLQPALYALAAEKLFGSELKVDCGRLYFCTSTARQRGGPYGIAGTVQPLFYR